jgi:DnaJ-class molecular chaperone
MPHRRAFFIALGVPRGAPTETIRVAYRRVVNRYRQELTEPEEENTEPPLSFAVMRTYSERRHTALFDGPSPAPTTLGDSEVDRFYHGYVPEVMPPRARREGKDLFVELRLDADEARAGGLFPVHIPVVKPCPSCADHSDEEGHLSCTLCHGNHRVTEDRMVEVTVPPRVKHRQTARVAMEDVGLGETDLIIHVLVDLD